MAILMGLTVDAEVNKLPKASNIKLPHIGWNEVNFCKQMSY